MHIISMDFWGGHSVDQSKWHAGLWASIDESLTYARSQFLDTVGTAAGGQTDCLGLASFGGDRHSFQAYSCWFCYWFCCPLSVARLINPQAIPTIDGNLASERGRRLGRVLAPSIDCRCLLLLPTGPTDSPVSPRSWDVFRQEFPFPFVLSSAWLLDFSAPTSLRQVHWI